jgi:uncharacterized membrane protein
MEETNSNDRLLVALGYIFTPIVPIIIMLMADKKEVPFIKAHNAQTLAIGVIQVILWVLSPLGCVTGIIALVLWLVQLYWAYQAYQGQDVNIPLITDFVKNQGWA